MSDDDYDEGWGPSAVIDERVRETDAETERLRRRRSGGMAMWPGKGEAGGPVDGEEW